MPGKAMLFDDRSERHRPPWLAADLGGRPSQVDWEELRTAGDSRARLWMR